MRLQAVCRIKYIKLLVDINEKVSYNRMVWSCTQVVEGVALEMR